MNHPLRHRALRQRALLAAAAATAVVVTGLAAPSTSAAPAAGPAAAVASTAPAATAAAPSAWEPRPEQYPGTVRTTDLPIEMDDGVTLRADLVQPADSEGAAIDKKLPVIVMITAYNKTVIGGGGGGLGGPGAPYLVKRGYNYLFVDARGTGGSEGQWAAFSAREAKDAGAVVEWAHEQAWSNGKVGMAGASYMGISQLWAATHRPAGLKAIVPQVPGADVYRDIVASGGQIDVGFMPLWLGLVTVTGLMPPAYGAEDPQSAFKMLLDHLLAGGDFTLTLALSALLGGEPAYDGPFYRERSVIEKIDRIDVPTLLVGGEFDLFQRGTPMIFDRLQRNGVPTKFILGPWDHLQGSSGAAVGEAGYGTMEELQLRWFDHYIKGRDGALGEIAPLTYYEQGSGRWVKKPRWIAGDLHARSYQLSGDASVGGQAGVLRRTSARAGEAVVPPVPVTGLCTRSANQWTAGIMTQFWPDNPCLTDNNLNDQLGITYETAPVGSPVRFQGPINAHLRVSTPSGDGMLSVAVEDVAPDGTVSRITGGWQVISFRELDRSRSRYLDGELIQPYHPFTKESKQKLAADQVAPVDVEIFPTGAVIAEGHRLRISIQAFDVPHLLSPLPDLPGTLVPITLHTSKRKPSYVTLPVR